MKRTILGAAAAVMAGAVGMSRSASPEKTPEPEVKKVRDRSNAKRRNYGDEIKQYYNPYRHLRKSEGSIATDKHKHQREIARRERQQESLRETYMMNGGFSRRGREVGTI